jgi:hypothetical protein
MSRITLLYFFAAALVLCLATAVVTTTATAHHEAVSDYETHFLPLLAKYEPLCTGEGNNSIPPRHKLAKQMPPLPDWKNKPWSIVAHPFLRDSLHKEQSGGSPGLGSGSWACREPAEVAALAAQFPDNAHTMNRTRTHDSNGTHTIQKSTCRLLWFKPHHVCEILNEYAYIHIDGDSLSRMMLQGMAMIASEDWRHGGYYFPHSHEIMEAQKQQCRCDGEFSESRVCETKTQVGPFAAHMINDRGVCKNGSHIGTKMHLTSASNFLKFKFTCRDLIEKPFVWYLQSGAWFGTNPDDTIAKFLKPAFEHLHKQLSACRHRVHVIVSGTTTCSDTVVKTYPFQHQKNSIRHNQVVREWLRENHPGVLFLDYIQLSAAEIAVNSTSDGFHFLSDYNIITANVFLNILNLISLNE